MNHGLKIQIKNELSELKMISKHIDDFVESHAVPIDVGRAIDLAIEEIVSNIIYYGYTDQREHTIDIMLSLRNSRVVVEIRDDAPPFNPLQAPIADTTSPIDERAVGGLGIHLVRQVMDDINYRYRNNRNILIMQKAIHS